MTYDEILTQLKALEVAWQAQYDYDVKMIWTPNLDGSGGIYLMDADYWQAIKEWRFDTPAELETVLAAALAEVGAS